MEIDLNTMTPVETNGAAPVVETVVETSNEDVSVSQTSESETQPDLSLTDETQTDEAPVETTEEVKTEEPKEEAKTDEKSEEPEVPAFDLTAELPELVTKVNEVVEKYELTPDLQAAFDALKAKAEAANTDILSEYSVYGGVEDVKSLLDRQTLLQSQRVDDTGIRRPNTDKFVEDVARISTDENDVIGWLHYDLSRQPSQKYQGYTRAQEFLVDGLRHPSDTSPQQVLDRLQKVTQAVMANEMPTNDVPVFIPQELHQAYYSLPRETREEIALLADDDTYGDQSAERGRKLQELSLIAKGLAADAQNNQFAEYQRQQAEQEFAVAVNTKQENFFDTFRDEFTKDLMKNVSFSSDPKMQSLLARQQVTLLTQAFDDGKVGEFARQALTEAQIPFDVTQATQLIKRIEDATIAHTIAERAVDENGQPLDKIALNKATKELENVTRQWQAFAKNIIDAEARLVATGTAEEAKKQIEKIKVAPKARVTPKGPGTPAKKETATPLYKSNEWYEKYANDVLEAEARRAGAYT